MDRAHNQHSNFFQQKQLDYCIGHELDSSKNGTTKTDFNDRVYVKIEKEDVERETNHTTIYIFLGM